LAEPGKSGQAVHLAGFAEASRVSDMPNAHYSVVRGKGKK